MLFARLHKFGKRFEDPNANFKSDIFVFDQKISTFRSQQGSSSFQQAESPGTPSNCKHQILSLCKEILWPNSSLKWKESIHNVV